MSQQYDYEVFVQPKSGQPFTHVGSVRASDDVLAMHFAKEVYTRRDNPSAIWVIRRDHIMMWNDSELFNIAFEKEYRKPGYFAQRHLERKTKNGR
jgi:ring-1,2-phenylacetyl-CoA epoxidase subunit PaaB